jgi:hypothetical protein
MLGNRNGKPGWLGSGNHHCPFSTPSRSVSSELSGGEIPHVNSEPMSGGEIPHVSDENESQ